MAEPFLLITEGVDLCLLLFFFLWSDDLFRLRLFKPIVRLLPGLRVHNRLHKRGIRVHGQAKCRGQAQSADASVTRAAAVRPPLQQSAVAPQITRPGSGQTSSHKTRQDLLQLNLDSIGLLADASLPRVRPDHSCELVYCFNATHQTRVTLHLDSCSFCFAASFSRNLATFGPTTTRQ